MQETAKIYELLMNEMKAFPSSQISPEGLALIAKRLDSRYSYEQVEKAMGRLAFKTKFFPTLAEIAEDIQQNTPTPKYSQNYRPPHVPENWVWNGNAWEEPYED